MPMITERTRLAVSDDVAHQSTGKGRDAVVLSLKSGYLYTCNDTTARFIRAVDGRRRIGEIVDIMEKDYTVARPRLSSDLLSLTKRLLDEGLVVVLPDENSAGE
jgi:hypothetical protein